MSSDLDQQVIYGLTYDSVGQLLDEPVLAEALRLYEGGQVTDALIEEAELFALVGKSSGSPQAAEMEVEDGEIYVGCTCEHGGPNLCAHVGAMLLAWIYEPESWRHGGITKGGLPVPKTIVLKQVPAP